jgi:hypothetical protein
MSQLIEISNQFKELQSRGEIAQEQIRILRQAMTAIKGKPQVPQSRGEVAAQEQMRILQQPIGRQNVLFLRIAGIRGEGIEYN